MCFTKRKGSVASFPPTRSTPALEALTHHFVVRSRAAQVLGLIDGRTRTDDQETRGGGGRGMLSTRRGPPGSGAGGCVRYEDGLLELEARARARGGGAEGGGAGCARRGGARPWRLAGLSCLRPGRPPAQTCSVSERRVGENECKSSSSAAAGRLVLGRPSRLSRSSSTCPPDHIPPLASRPVLPARPLPVSSRLAPQQGRGHPSLLELARRRSPLQPSPAPPPPRPSAPHGQLAGAWSDPTSSRPSATRRFSGRGRTSAGPSSRTTSSRSVLALWRSSG